MQDTHNHTTSYNKAPNYKEIEALNIFLTQRMRIASRERSKLNAKEQRALSKHIKYARYLALIPYTSYQKNS